MRIGAISQAVSVALACGLWTGLAGAEPVATTSRTSETVTASSSASAETGNTLSITVNTDGKETKITRDATGITVIYPGPDGAVVTAKGKDVAELSANDSRAADLYKRYTSNFHMESGEGPFGRGTVMRFRAGQFPARPPELVIPRQLDLGNLSDGERDRINESIERARQQLDEVRRQLDTIMRDAQTSREEAGERRQALQERIAQLNDTGPRLGVQISAPDETLRAQLGDGVVVDEVLTGSRAEKIGLRKYDLIRSIDGKPITDRATLRKALTEASGPVKLDLTRGGVKLTLTEPADALPPASPPTTPPASPPQPEPGR
jgi:hypothetical protein